MQIPAAMQIESAIDTLPKIEKCWLDDQIKELHSAVGSDTAKRLDINYPPSDDFNKGYQLGLQTARVMIFMSGVLRMQGINPDEVL